MNELILRGRKTATESNVRQKATRRHYRVWKSRSIVNNMDYFGQYILIDALRNCIVLGPRFNATLEDIDSFLNEIALAE